MARYESQRSNPVNIPDTTGDYYMGTTNDIVKELLAAPNQVVQVQNVNQRQQEVEQFKQDVKTQEIRVATINKALTELNEVLAEIKQTNAQEGDPIFLTLKKRKGNFYTILTNKQYYEAA